jgi:protein SCO1
MSKKAIVYIAFFAVLVVGFFAVLSMTVPGFTKRRINPIGYVKPFSFINQDGKTVTEKNIKNKVVAVEFFFTTCRGICPRMNNNMKKVYEELNSEKDFLILSHTCDPETDSPAVLKRYADSMKVDTKRWVFLTGRKDSLYSMARHSYKIDDPQNHFQKIEDDFLHSQFIALVTRKGEILKIYDGLKQSEMKELVVDARKHLKN